MLVIYFWARGFSGIKRENILSGKLTKFYASQGLRFNAFENLEVEHLAIKLGEIEMIKFQEENRLLVVGGYTTRIKYFKGMTLDHFYNENFDSLQLSDSDPGIASFTLDLCQDLLGDECKTLLFTNNSLLEIQEND